jgi:hypothetical protein
VAQGPHTGFILRLQAVSRHHRLYRAFCRQARIQALSRDMASGPHTGYRQIRLYANNRCFPTSLLPLHPPADALFPPRLGRPSYSPCSNEINASPPVPTIRAAAAACVPVAFELRIPLASFAGSSPARTTVISSCGTPRRASASPHSRERPFPPRDCSVTKSHIARRPGGSARVGWGLRARVPAFARRRHPLCSRLESVAAGVLVVAHDPAVCAMCERPPAMVDGAAMSSGTTGFAPDDWLSRGDAAV